MDISGISPCRLRWPVGDVPCANGRVEVRQTCIVAGRHRAYSRAMTGKIFAYVGTENAVVLARIFGSLFIGALIGLERSFHGRPAGFRTHALVCVASALLMLVTVYQNEWMTHVTPEAIRTDPMRMAQGIMT